MRKLALAVGLTIMSSLFVASTSCAETYIYNSSTDNPLYVPSITSSPDYITLEFTIAFKLAPNTVYDISTTSGPPTVPKWKANDSLFGISLDGSGAPISLSVYPGLLAGGALSFCDVSGASCFGGAVATNARGQISAWNLVADGAPSQPYLTFITYNDSFLGSIDGLGSVQSGREELALNTLNGPTGSWTEVPEPGIWSMMLIGLGALGTLKRSRAKRNA